jgi:hypothetical protein
MLGYVVVVLPLAVLLGESVFFEHEMAPKMIRPMRAAIAVTLFII